MLWSQIYIYKNDQTHCFFWWMFFSGMLVGPWKTWGHWWGGICFCAIYESDLEHENEEASSDDISSECDNSQDTVQAAVPGGVTTDEGSLYSFPNYLHVTAINIQIPFLAKFPTWKFEKISQASHFPGKTRPSAVVAKAGGKARGATSWRMLEKFVQKRFHKKPKKVHAIMLRWPQETVISDCCAD